MQLDVVGARHARRARPCNGYYSQRVDALKSQYKAWQRLNQEAVGNHTAPKERRHEASLLEVEVLVPAPLLHQSLFVPLTHIGGVDVVRSKGTFELLE